MKKKILSLCILLVVFCICAIGTVSASEAESGIVIDLSTLTDNLIFSDGKSYSMNGGSIRGTYEGSITLMGSTSYSVLFHAGTHDVIFDDVSIVAGSKKAVHLSGGSALNLTLKGESHLESSGGTPGNGYAGLSLDAGTLTITAASTGKLTAIGGYGSAGIGGSYGIGGFDISILGGTIVATGGSNGAGIGSGVSASWDGSITISDANVTAIGGGDGAGIGSGRFAGNSIFTVSIKNSTVVASGASGIGCGYDSSGSAQSATVTIENSTVTASGTYGVGIGGGANGKFDAITVKNSTVNASTTSMYGAGIGSWCYTDKATDTGTITIENSTVTAVGGNLSAGIGGGYNTSNGPIIIEHSNIFASGYRAVGAGYYGTTAAPKNANGDELTQTTVTLDGVTNDIPVTKVEGAGGYESVSLDTIGGKLYLYLPAGDSPTKVVANGNEYVNDGAGTFSFAHTCAVGETGTEATCTEKAVCGTCLQYFGEKNEANHIFESSICTICGYICDEHIFESSICTICGHICDDHSFESGICAICGHACEHEGGVFNCTVGYICDICNTEYTLPLGHSLGMLVFNTEGTEHYRECANCDYEEREAHDFSDWVYTNVHFHTRECSTCHYQVSAEHNYAFENLGSEHKGTCIDCRNEFTERHLDLHNYRPVDVNTHVVACGVCDFDITEEHQYSLFERVDDENHKKYCYNCNFELIANHSFGYYISNGDGDCDTRGTETASCDGFCGAMHTRPDESTGNGHELTDWEYDEQNDGLHCRECDNDGCDHTETEVHSFGEWVVEDEATETEEGLEYRVCSACDHREERDIPPTGIPSGGENASGDASDGSNAEDNSGTDDGGEAPGKDPENEKGALSGGAIAGIVTGSTLAVGAGGFSLFWFVIKKKKMSDLIGIFKK